MKTCPSCGAPVDGGVETCREFFDALLANEYADFRYARVHRALVDAYALQHRDHFMVSGKSFAAHLTGACAAVEFEDAERINAIIQAWLSTNPSLEPSPAAPEDVGAITVMAAFETSSPDEYFEVVRRWIRAAWDAWSEYHEHAREVIDRAMNG